MNLYLDTSALIKLLVEEPGSELARAVYSDSEFISTSALAHVEASSALARMQKGKRLSATQVRAALKSLEAIWDVLYVHAVTTEVIRMASRAALDHALRAYDALHLASMMAFANGEQMAFACWDRELRRAAGQLGFALVPEQV